MILRFTPGVDQANASHVAVGHLVTAEVYRVGGRKFGINFLIRFSEFKCGKSPVNRWEFLFYDVSLDRCP